MFHDFGQGCPRNPRRGSIDLNHGGAMDRVYTSLARMKALWLELEGAKPKTSEYDALMKQMQAESAVYKALVNAEKKPHRKREDPN
jgi:hypothetical protein